MSYTLRGRIESRVMALLPVLLAACALTAVLHRWWPVELVALMGAAGIALDCQLWHRVLPYQPAWALVPLGAVELGLLMAIVYGLGLQAPLLPALALFGVAWATATACGQVTFPLLRLGYAEDGGELGRTGVFAIGAVVLALAGAGATVYARRPPVVHLDAGVHQGPIVITRREVLQGEPGAVVRGGIVIRHDDVQVKDVTVVGGDNGIDVEGVDGTVLDGVSVSGATLDGIHVRLADIVIRGCRVDMLGNRFGQGIDVSYNTGFGPSMIEGCTVVGGMEGITVHSSMSEVMGNRVSHTQMRGISMTEMSMGSVMDNVVRDARGIGIWCNDRSVCMVEGNTVVDTRPDPSGDASRRGYGLQASFRSQAEVRDNALASNPVPQGAVVDSLITAARH